MNTPRDTHGTPARPDSDLLLASIAHELNNILASLRGFVEPAGEAPDLDAARATWGEVRIGVERIATLAADVAALARHPATPEAIALGSCAPDELFLREGLPPIRWQLDGRLLVRANASLARSALPILARLAGPPGEVTCHPGKDDMADAECMGCGAASNAQSAWFSLPLPAGRGGPATPPAHRCMNTYQLRLAALTQVVHAAGGHLVLGCSPDCASVVFALA